MSFVYLFQLSLQAISFIADDFELIFKLNHLLVRLSDSLLCTFCYKLDIIFFLWRLVFFAAFLVLVVVTELKLQKLSFFLFQAFLCNYHSKVIFNIILNLFNLVLKISDCLPQ